MSVKLASLTLVAALFASSSVFADQPFGRDSVYAAPGASTSTKSGPVTAIPGNGRGSVYATDLPAPTGKDRVQVAVSLKPGRS